MHPIEKRSLEIHPLSIGRLLLEMAMIVFGILLALNLETCKERRHERKLESTALANIRSEIERNRAAVAENLPKHKEILAVFNREIERLDKLRKERRGLLEEEPIAVSLMPTTVYQNAWETATLTRALSKVEYRTMMALASIYELQRWMTRIEDKWLQLLDPAAFEMSRRHWFLAIVASMVQNYIAVEEGLLKSYDNALTETLLPAKE
jgi:hypothetical protein